MMHAFFKKTHGFTLIELLIVIGIIGILATLAVVSLTSAQQTARDAKRITDIGQIRNALELYWSQYATYPTTDLSDWSSLGDALTAISPMPVDPDHVSKSTAYWYIFEKSSGDKYFVAADLEDPKHQALQQDDDGTVPVHQTGEEWVAINSIDGTVGDFTAFDCTGTDDESVYCLSGDVAAQ